MTISFPLGLNDFFKALCPISTTFELSEAYVTTETGGGEILTASYGPMLWQGTVTAASMSVAQHDKQLTLVENLRQPGGSFMVYRRPAYWPAWDPHGAILGAAAPTITALALNNRDIAIAGLPPGYVLTIGDLLSFAYGSSPTRYALHRVMETQVAGAGGNILNVEVSPPVRPGFVAPRPLTLVRPFCKAIMVPGSYQAGARPARGFAGGFSFAWRQSLR